MINCHSDMQATKGEGTVELPENELEKTEAQQLPQQNQQTADKQDNNLHTNENEGKQAENVDHPKHGLTPENPIRLSVVACGDRAGETLVLLKSAVIFSHRYLFFHLFAEDNVKIELSREVRQSFGVQFVFTCLHALLCFVLCVDVLVFV